MSHQIIPQRQKRS